MEDRTKQPADYLNPTNVLGHLEIQPGMWVGDFGVGAGGHFVIPIATLAGADGGVVMFDVMKPALSGAMSRAKLGGVGNYRAVWTNLEIYEGAPGVADNSLDAGVLINVLHQSKKHLDMLTEIGRMLKSQAKLLVVDWQPDARSTIAPPADRRMSREYVEDVAQQANLHTVSSFTAGPYHWGLVLAKA
jgi:ubiquinone/menaquinone biosynthesis C-methylase UbiE